MTLYMNISTIHTYTFTMYVIHVVHNKLNANKNNGWHSCDDFQQLVVFFRKSRRRFVASLNTRLSAILARSKDFSSFLNFFNNNPSMVCFTHTNASHNGRDAKTTHAPRRTHTQTRSSVDIAAVNMHLHICM
ncbi:unnamed protein product [Ceratitis capitata]|uniref:(Mediterranean fruit fly) hypothetical protein n=1 Tax=Ceratitis capitata TaxID=7213 RepID=A0A811V2R8_CERCA|nr:unnamed protein product [Ceratitis capitata]